jgi:hypothetical protein
LGLPAPAVLVVAPVLDHELQHFNKFNDYLDIDYLDIDYLDIDDDSHDAVN